MIVRHAESKTRVRLHLALVHCNISCMLAHSYPGCDRFSCRKRMGLSLGRSTVYGKEGITEAVRVRRATAKGIVRRKVSTNGRMTPQDVITPPARGAFDPPGEDERIQQVDATA